MEHGQAGGCQDLNVPRSMELGSKSSSPGVSKQTMAKHCNSSGVTAMRDTNTKSTYSLPGSRHITSRYSRTAFFHVVLLFGWPFRWHIEGF